MTLKLLKKLQGIGFIICNITPLLLDYTNLFKMKKYLFWCMICFLFSIVACKKVEGQGGTSSISGRVYIEEYDAFGEIIQEYYAAEERVFIIYGEEDNIYDDDFRTSFDGSFRFEFLTKGSYKIFVYQDCLSCPSGEQAVIEEITISSNKSTIVLPDIIIRK